jgi:hypothetical protein
MLLKVTIVVVAVLVGLVLVVVGIGALLPKAHIATRFVRLRRGSQEVWNTIRDIDHFSEWHPGLNRIERLPDSDGRLRWKEKGAQGTITFELVEAVPPSKMVTRIADPSLPFGGSWTYVVDPTPDGSKLTITEHERSTTRSSGSCLASCSDTRPR